MEEVQRGLTFQGEVPHAEIPQSQSTSPLHRGDPRGQLHPQLKVASYCASTLTLQKHVA
jgi:hypothetical protein